MDNNAISYLLDSLGVSRRYLGHAFAAEAILRMGNTAGYAAPHLLHTIYEPLAQRYGCRPQQVERNLRTVVQRAWCINRTGMQHLCPYPLNAAPSVGEFLDIVVTHLLRNHPDVFTDPPSV